jgi:hypothetical protein
LITKKPSIFGNLGGGLATIASPTTIAERILRVLAVKNA